MVLFRCFCGASLETMDPDLRPGMSVPCPGCWRSWIITAVKPTIDGEGAIHWLCDARTAEYDPVQVTDATDHGELARCRARIAELEAKAHETKTETE